MRGIWKSEGQQQFIVTSKGESVAMDTFVWEADGEVGKMSIPFGCVCEERPRRFYCLPVLTAWRDRKQPEQFLKQGCRLGSRLLVQFEQALQASLGGLPQDVREAAYAGKVLEQGQYEFFSAIFRNRLGGHVKPERSFRRTRDFFTAQDWESRKQPPPQRNRIESVIPGLDEEVDRGLIRKGPAELIALAQEKALEGAARSSRAECDPVIGCELPGRTFLDELLVDGVPCPGSGWSVDATYQWVSKALIQGSNPDAQMETLVKNRDEWRYFFRRLMRAFLDLKRSEKKFDWWLKVEREHGFLRLLPGGNSLKGEDREAARNRAKGYYRQLLWSAYQVMSRCYGSLMLLVWVNFTRSQLISPTTVESQLFRQVNAPQLYLAGLPLAFFLPTHLRWLMGPLMERWNKECFDPSAYAPLTSLLGLHADALESKRADDRERQRRRRAGQHSGRRYSRQRPTDGAVLSEAASDSLGHSRPTEQVFVCEDDEPFLDDPLDFPLCEQGKCPNCEAQAKFSKMIIRKGDWIIAEIGCPACGFEDTVRIPGPPDA